MFLVYATAIIIGTQIMGPATLTLIFYLVYGLPVFILYSVFVRLSKVSNESVSQVSFQLVILLGVIMLIGNIWLYTGSYIFINRDL